jgi:hypothetical protein
LSGHIVELVGAPEFVPGLDLDALAKIAAAAARRRLQCLIGHRRGEKHPGKG